jgi:hypothetical protein
MSDENWIAVTTSDGNRAAFKLDDVVHFQSFVDRVTGKPFIEVQLNSGRDFVADIEFEDFWGFVWNRSTKTTMTST